jgi:phosphoribosylanthranilate isomerase
MLPFQIKICGVTTPEDALCACRCGADAVGLNFFKRSSRFIDGETAGEIARAVNDHNREIAGTTNPNVKKIGVFVDMPVPEMAAIAWQVGLDGIQLHGDESPTIVERIRSELGDFGHRCILIRAIRTKPVESPNVNLDSDTRRVSADITMWIKNKIDLVLLDAAVPGEYGGTGKTVDWSCVPDCDDDVPFVLAGGLTPENVGEAIRKSGYPSVDVASGVESGPGVKDHKKVQAFVESARQSFG